MHDLEYHTTGSSSTALASCLSPRFAAAYSRLQQGPLSQEDLRICLEYLLRLFTGMSTGLVQNIEPDRPEITALASGPDRPLQYERLLRFSINLLRHSDNHLARQTLLAIFFPHTQREDLSIPLHTIWLQLSSEASALLPLSRWNPDSLDQASLLPRYHEVLETWVSTALPILQTIEWKIEFNQALGHQEVHAWQTGSQIIPLIPPCPWQVESAPQPSAESTEWNPQWSNTEMVQIIHDLPQRFPALEVIYPPDFLLNSLRQQVAHQASAYLLLDAPAGSGKSLTLAGLRQSLSQELMVLHFSVRNCFRGDFQTLIEEIDEGIQSRLESQITSLMPLGPLVVQELNRRYASLAAAEKFRAYLSQLVLRNGQRFVVALDGLDEAFEGSDSNISLADYLPEQLPDGVFLLLAYRSDGCSARLQRRIIQLLERGAIVLPLNLGQPVYINWCKDLLGASFIDPQDCIDLLQTGYSLMEARLLGQALRVNQLPTTQWPSPEDVLTELLTSCERRWGDPWLRLLMVMATSYTSVPIEELSDLGFAPSLVREVIRDVPALFLAQPPTANSGWQLQLAHENLRLHLQEHYSYRYSQTCQRLAARAAHQLLHRPIWTTADTETLHLGSFRLDCLYRWLLDSQNQELTQSVVSNKQLNQFRNEVCGYLEQHGRFHHKLSILQGFKSCLEFVLNKHDLLELRDQLAWAYNSRGLTYLNLGQFACCLEELQLAEQQFRLLIEQRLQVHYRSGLASTLNRRSEALRWLGQVGEAWECAHQSVEHHRQSLLEGGPQQPRLGLARALVQRARCAADHSLWPRVLADLHEALNLLEQSTRQAQARNNPNDVSTHFNEWIKALIVRAEAYRVQGEHDNSLLDLDQALLLTQHLEEIQGINWIHTKAPEVQILQAGAYKALQGLEEAQEAYDEAIHGYSQQVHQGRLDLRLSLAEAYQARAQLHHKREQFEEAITDFTRSLALQTQLIECEEQSHLRPFRAQAYKGRGDCLSQFLQRREALQDYDKAIEDFLYSLNSGNLQQTDLRKLASVYFSSGQLYLYLGEASQAADRTASAIRLWEERLGAPAEEVAQAHLLQAEALHLLGDSVNSMETVTKAIQALSLRIANEGSKLTRKLAGAHRLRAQLAQAQGDCNQALKDFGLAFHLYGDQAGQEPDRKQQAEVLRYRAALQVSQHENDAALEDLQAASDLLSDEPEKAWEESLQLRHLRAHILKRQERYSLAISELLAALEELRQRRAHPDLRLEILLELMSNQAHLQLWQDFSILYVEFLTVREEQAQAPVTAAIESLFKQIIAASPSTNKAADNLARSDVLVALGRLCNQLQPQSGGLLLAQALFLRGGERLQHQLTTEALEDLSESIAQLRSQSNPACDLLTQVYARRAQGLLRAGLDARALRDLNAANQLLLEQPGNPRLLAEIALQKSHLLQTSGQFSQVIQELSSVLALDETHGLGAEILSWMYLGRALAYDKLKQNENAAADFREAAQLLSQISADSSDILQERLRCRLRLLALENPSHSNFLHFCAEDSLICLSRLRQHSIDLAANWIIPWAYNCLQLPPGLLTPRLLTDMADELSHYQPGPLSQAQCQQLSPILGRLGYRSQQPVAGERLLGASINLALAGNSNEQLMSLLDNMALLGKLYLENPQHRPTFSLKHAGSSLDQIQKANPPTGDVGVHWNNVIKIWLSLKPEQLSACALPRSQLQELRLW